MKDLLSPRFQSDIDRIRQEIDQAIEVHGRETPRGQFLGESDFLPIPDVVVTT
jgi:hypothetical protein